VNLTYEAIDGSGRTVRDLVQADTVRAAVEQLRQRGLMVTHVERTSPQATEQTVGQAGAATADLKLPLRQLVVFTRQMAMLLASGSAVVSALSAITRQLKKPEHVGLVKKISQDLEEGTPLADALRRWPKTFDAAYCAVVAAGEASATLPAMFDRLSKIVGKRRVVRNKVIASTLYPTLLVLLCAATLGIMLFFVLPRFGDMFMAVGVPLPATTRAMLAISGFLLAYWPVLLFCLLAVLGAAAFAVFHPAGRQWCANVQIKLPLLGRVMSGLIQGQIFRTLGMLLEARVGVLDALDLARETTRNGQFRSLFGMLDDAVAAGNPLSNALEASGLIQPAICQAIRTGEESGNLGTAMTYAADVLDEDNVELVGAVTRLMEPVILIVMGLIVGVVAVSLFLPLFDITTMVS
jgi:type II secretory pathway component PulF